MVSDRNILVWKWSKIAWLNLVLQNMVETTLPDGLETSGRRVYRKFWHNSRGFKNFRFWMIFSVKKKKFLVILGPRYCGIGATIRIGRDMLCLPYAGIFNQGLANY